MSGRALSLALLLLLPFAACKSPQRARIGDGAQPGRSLADLPPSAFASFPATNGIPGQWLRPPADPFILGPGDVLDIELLGEANTAATAMIGPDGKVYYNLLPGTFIWGLTLPQAKEKLESEFARFFVRRPEIGVSLRAATSQRIWMLGEVAAPGVYPLSTPLTVLEAISVAGGPATNNLTASFILRKGLRIPVDLSRLLEAGDLSQNIYLEPDDFVFLQSGKNHQIYVMGAVIAPTAVPYQRNVSLVTAISYAGGPVPYAAMSQVAIVRGSLSQPSIATVNFNRIRHGELADVQLEPGDIVYVPLSTFYKVEMLLNSILDTFVRTIAVNEGQNAVISGREGIRPTIPVGPIAP